MDNSLMVGLLRQVTLRRSMEITANNIANMNTPGFKAEALMLEEVEPRRAEMRDGGVSYVHDWSVARDFRDGAMTQTGGALDMAIEGEGFFALQTDNGVQYTRDGRFMTDSSGRLTAQDGAAVLDDAGNEIMLDPYGPAPTVTPTGAIMVNGAEIGRIGVNRFDNLSALQKAGDSRYIAGEGAVADPVGIPSIKQGFVEGSNVNSISQLTHMMEINRSYQSVSKMIQDAGELHRKAIDRLGRVEA